MPNTFEHLESNERTTSKFSNICTEIWTSQGFDGLETEAPASGSAEEYLPDLKLDTDEPMNKGMETELTSLPESVEPGLLSTVELNIDGMQRAYQIYVPESHEGPFPVVYVLHGITDEDPSGLMDRETEMSRYAEERGFVVVYPLAVTDDDGLASWNSPGAGLTENDPSYNDVDYIAFVVDSVQNQLGLNIDRNDQILTGFSEGGEFVHHLVGEMPGVFTDRAAVHGTLTGTETKPTDEMPVVLIHGSGDEMLPFDGGMGIMSWAAQQATGAFDRVQESNPMLQFEWAAEANGCEWPARIETAYEYHEDFLDLGSRRYDITLAELPEEQCNGNPVRLYYLSPGQHAWHGVGEGGMFMGEKNEYFNATETILDNTLGY